MNTIFLLASFFIAQAASNSGSGMSEAQIVEIARQATLRYCQDHEAVFGGYYKTRCEFIASRTSDGWFVSGHPVYENSRGQQSIVEGGDVVLYYSITGELISHEGAHF
ncbi:hypothetical protein [Dyella sp. C9]|uniref:hypothetical protein n=1 Tax=Dyella sp. C9 TaxID=2202154 RepID=UPI000DEEC747|nr:hypothetical protein [Dyella sp. C9]